MALFVPYYILPYLTLCYNSGRRLFPCLFFLFHVVYCLLALVLFWRYAVHLAEAPAEVAHGGESCDLTYFRYVHLVLDKHVGSTAQSYGSHELCWVLARCSLKPAVESHATHTHIACQLLYGVTIVA